MGVAFAASVRSDVGLVRDHNEDAVFASPRLVAVADGVGGQAAGEVASRVIVLALASLDKRRVAGALQPELEAAVAHGNETLAFLAACRPAMRGMATTLTAVALEPGLATVLNIGDSRTYLWRDDRLSRLTRDDSLVQELIDSGALDPTDARSHPQRSVVLAALDGSGTPRPAVTRTPVRPGDRLLLCSDGLSDVIEDAELAAALGVADREACADRLLELALAAGARDNVSLVVADVVPAPDPIAAWA
jgi:protein phosphatase